MDNGSEQSGSGEGIVPSSEGRRVSDPAAVLNDTNTSSSRADDCVPFFASSKGQIQFEFWFLVSSLVAAILAAFFTVWLCTGSMRPLYLAAIGGFLGGWTFDAKWFYRVTARGRDDQHKHNWQRHKFYWRVFIPFVAGLISFSIYLLASSGILPMNVKDPISGRTAFGLCFFMGLFTDVMLSKMASWTEKTLPDTTKKS